MGTSNVAISLFRINNQKEAMWNCYMQLQHCSVEFLIVMGKVGKVKGGTASSIGLLTLDSNVHYPLQNQQLGLRQ